MGTRERMRYVKSLRCFDFVLVDNAGMTIRLVYALPTASFKSRVSCTSIRYHRLSHKLCPCDMYIHIVPLNIVKDIGEATKLLQNHSSRIRPCAKGHSALRTDDLQRA